MRVRVGFWPCKSEFGVEFLEADARFLATASDRFTVVLQGRTLTITPTAAGQLLYRQERQAVGFTHRISAIVKGADLPMFELTDMEMDYEEDCLILELPADHELPWPSKRSLTVLAKSKRPEDLKAFCEDQVQARVNSAVASGKTIIPVPGHIRLYAEPGVYLRCLQTAKVLAGVS